MFRPHGKRFTTVARYGTEVHYCCQVWDRGSLLSPGMGQRFTSVARYGTEVHYCRQVWDRGSLLSPGSEPKYRNEVTSD